MKRRTFNAVPPSASAILLLAVFVQGKLCSISKLLCRAVYDLSFISKINASINSSGAHPPPGNRRAFAHVASPGDGAFAILSRPRGWTLAYPGATRVFERQISFFIGKDEAFVKDWLVHQGLGKLVDVF